mgnify:FL=1|jgi:hypothetical protein
MKKYIGEYLGDFILCILIGTGLALNVFAGYEMTDPWSGHLWAVAGMVTAVMVLLFAAYYKRILLVISFIAEAAALIAAIIILQKMGVFTASKTIDQNPLLFWIIVISTSVLVFWAARSRAGIIILFLAGTIMTAAFDFLQFPVCQGGYLAFVFGAFVLLLYRIYCISFRHSDKVQAAFSRYFVQSLIISLAALMLAGGVYYGLVKPTSPPTDQLKLTAQLMSMDIVRKAGISSVTVIPANEMVREVQKENQSKDHNEPEKEEKIVQGQNPMTTKKVTFPLPSNFIWMTAVSIIVLLILAMIIKLLGRKRWYRALLQQSKEDSALELYNYFLKKIRKTGCGRPDGHTLLEYAYGLQTKLEPYAVGDANFLSLTQIYTKILYGCQNISEDEWELFIDFYKELNHNLKKEMGSLRYLVHLFSI